MPKAYLLTGSAVLLSLAAIGATLVSRTPPTASSAPPVGEAHHDPDVVLPASLPAVGGYLLLLGGMCLSEKGARDRSGLIYLRPCYRSFPERRLKPYEGALWRVTIVHPEFGDGCMGVVSASALAGAAMSDDNCERVQTERFTLRRVPGGYHLIPEGGDLCVGTPGAPRKDAQVLQLPCDPHAPGQVFSIRSAK